MNRQELTAWASPPCHICGEPIQRVEQSWARQEGEWVPDKFYMVCAEGHRVQVEHFT